MVFFYLEGEDRYGAFDLFVTIFTFKQTIFARLKNEDIQFRGVSYDIIFDIKYNEYL